MKLAFLTFVFISFPIFARAVDNLNLSSMRSLDIIEKHHDDKSTYPKLKSHFESICRSEGKHCDVAAYYATEIKEYQSAKSNLQKACMKDRDSCCELIWIDPLIKMQKGTSDQKKEVFSEGLRQYYKNNCHRYNFGSTVLLNAIERFYADSDSYQLKSLYVLASIRECETGGRGYCHTAGLIGKTLGKEPSQLASLFHIDCENGEVEACEELYRLKDYNKLTAINYSKELLPRNTYFIKVFSSTSNVNVFVAKLKYMGFQVLYVSPYDDILVGSFQNQLEAERFLQKEIKNPIFNEAEIINSSTPFLDPLRSSRSAPI